MQQFIRRSVAYLGACAITFVLIAPLAGAAQDDPNAGSTDADGTAVARVSVIDGSVALQRGDSNDSLAAAVNAPVLGGDYITTGDASRAEVQLDGYAQVRLSQDVQMRFTQLDPANRSLQLAAGTVDMRLLHGTDGTTAIDTPSITVEPQRSGSYRVTVTSDGRTLVTVRSGEARIVTPQGSQYVQPGSTLIALGAAADPTIQSRPPLAFDDFDRFNATRDRAYAYAAAQSAYVNPDVGGVADLASSGNWVDDGSYGHVWIPAGVGPDWAPYRNGRWVWEDGYGWTWVAAEPWGWAPYHYGSWYHNSNYGWCWYPPQPNVVVPWRPALVAFIGFGAGAGFGLGFGGGNAFGNIGWVPLAPFEPYHPWWGNHYGDRGGTVVNNVTNITNITTVTNNINVYRNVRYNAVSSVSSQRFLQGNFTRNVAVSPAHLYQAQVFHGAVPVVPTASNLRFTSNGAPAAVAVRRVFIEHQFAGKAIAVRRTPFTQQRIALATATHAALTPLHFKDAESTPLTVQRAPNRAVVSATKQTSPAAAVPVVAAPPAPAGAGSANAWARFHATRTPSIAAPRGNAVPHDRLGRTTPNVVDDRTQSTATLDRTPAAAATQHSPGQGETNHFPANSTFHQAAANTDVYRAPAHSDIRHAPPNADIYHSPANPDVYHAPAHADISHAPARADIYHAPANANIYHAPANADIYRAPNHSEAAQPAARAGTAAGHEAQSSHAPKAGIAPGEHAPARR